MSAVPLTRFGVSPYFQRTGAAAWGKEIEVSMPFLPQSINTTSAAAQT